MEKHGENTFTTQHGGHAWRSEVVGRLLETLELLSVIP
ncbi:hypothetical protein ymoll0001_18100 [Yersinia mollaretii ATCC 43969]|uniref:Uncharacterized protein n=1 Tax=Yersinia mollaretii (strain ATCC 43969 / DSM 18520 / CIP 103324 / CNY 7263 / WAIP 204) TaxID=349967 RepID=A0ABM9Y7W8_YERMW|nr:hypothetical protein ymoll0001_18100 [Yersinia mollaretii ATCC 43969]